VPQPVVVVGRANQHALLHLQHFRRPREEQRVGVHGIQVDAVREVRARAVYQRAEHQAAALDPDHLPRVRRVVPAPPVEFGERGAAPFRVCGRFGPVHLNVHHGLGTALHLADLPQRHLVRESRQKNPF
jgi:hypothetical protein